MVSWICPNLPFRGSMLRNVQCTPCKIRTIICGNVLCESVKLNEPHVRWCDRSAAKAVSYSILWRIKRNILSGFYTDLLVRRVANRLAPFCAFLSFYTDPLVRRVYWHNQFRDRRGVSIQTRSSGGSAVAEYHRRWCKVSIQTRS